jgi:hypothetical protein
MIPSLALMIGAYIGFRMIEVVLMTDSRYASRTDSLVVKVLAGVVFVVSGLACLNILLSGASFPAAH